jgi:DNA-binding NarL/FixJ family response regulator
LPACHESAKSGTSTLACQGAITMSLTHRPRVLLVDDHNILLEGLKRLLQGEFELVGEVGDGHALLGAVKTTHPDVVVADISMPHLNGIDAMALVRKEYPRMRFVLLTMHHEVAYARRALEAGASAYVLKHSACNELITAIRAALEGKTYITPMIAGEVFQAMRNLGSAGAGTAPKLTPRQRAILQMVAEGHSAKEIAARLDISARTVEFHKYQIMDILNLHNTAELIHYAVREGLVAL